MIIPLVVTISLAFALIHLILAGMIKFAIVLSLLPALTFFVLKSTHEQRIALILLSLSFPVGVPALGKDMGTITTLVILSVSFLTLLDVLLRRQSFEGTPSGKWIYLLLTCGMLTFISAPQGSFITAVRYAYIFAAALLLFLMIYKKNVALPQDAQRFVEALITGLLLIGVFQAIVGILAHQFPSTGPLFKPFFRTLEGMDGLSVRVTDTSRVRRLVTLMTGPEASGEMFVMLAPLCLYKFLEFGKKRYVLVYFVFGVAELLTATRSTILLFAVATFLTIFAHLKVAGPVRAFGLLTLLMIGGVVGIALRPQLAQGVLERFQNASVNIKSDAGFSTIMNRQDVWAAAAENMSELTPFGRGFLSATHYVGEPKNFHNLYLTILYQMGWFGAAIFFLTLLWIFMRLMIGHHQVENASVRFLIFCCLISMGLLLINEFKYEFTRREPYQQFVWAMLGLFAFIAVRVRELTEARLAFVKQKEN